jgi:peptidoglycan hydrolase CwlO-like protein
MKTSRITYRQITALCAILTLTLVSGATFTPAHPTATNRAAAAPDLRGDLSSEARALESFCDELAAFDKQLAQLNKKASVLRTDIDPLQRKSGDLKGRVSGVQNTLREIIRKLKAANAWDDLDAKTLANVTDGKSRTIFQQSSLKKNLEEAAANLGSQANDISNPLDNLRKKLAGQTFAPARDFSVVRVAYTPPTPMFFAGLRCTLGTIRLGLIHRLGGNANNATLDTVSCACNPDKKVGVGTGTACAEIN